MVKSNIINDVSNNIVNDFSNNDVSNNIVNNFSDNLITPIIDYKSELINIKSDIELYLNSIINLFDELSNDKQTVVKCKYVLGILNSKGLDVSSSFVPLEDQSNYIQSVIDQKFFNFNELKLRLGELENDLKLEANKVGPLDTNVSKISFVIATED